MPESESNKNRILTENPSLESNAFEYGIAQWATQILRTILVVSSLVAALLASWVWGKVPPVMAGLLWLLAAAFIMMAVHPRLARARVYFMASKEGLFFPSDEGSFFIPKNYGNKWLFVPWINIAAIEEALVHTIEGLHTKGVVLHVNASHDESKDFLSPHLLLHERFKKNKDGSKKFGIGYINLFQSASKTVAALMEFKKQHELLQS